MVTTLRTLSTRYSKLEEQDIDWLELLVADWPLLADLATGDVVLWVPTEDGNFLAVEHARPAGLITMFYRDIIGSFMRDDWREVVDRAMNGEVVSQTPSLSWYDEAPMHMTAYTVGRHDPDTDQVVGPIAVLTVHASASLDTRSTKVGRAYLESAHELFHMIQEGSFPSPNMTKNRPRGAPRASDGVMRIDADGIVTFASPNTLTSFARLGFRDELEGENLSEVVAEIVAGERDTNESLPLIAQAKTSKRADIESNRRVITMRSIPVILQNERVGGLILTRDVTTLRQQTQELITKDATIREIHHRVKNNLQTVASLLRVQARRAQSDEAKQVLGQAMRRVAAIAVVHDTLASGVSQIVDFDEVFDRVVGLAAEVASLHNTVVHLVREGDFGEFPSVYATPLALALTEVVTNAVEHGLAEREGTVKTSVTRESDSLVIRVVDDGEGLPGGHVGDGLGTQIVRTLVEGELGGTITWAAGESEGTVVTITVPLRWIDAESE